MFQNLPLEVYENVLKYLEFNYLVTQLCLVNKTFHKIVYYHLNTIILDGYKNKINFKQVFDFIKRFRKIDGLYLNAIHDMGSEEFDLLIK
jgi:hypothetical protein